MLVRSAGFYGALALGILVLAFVSQAYADTTTTTSPSSPSPTDVLSLSGILTPSDEFFTGSVDSSKLHDDDDDDDDDDDGERATQIVGGVLMGLIVVAVILFIAFVIWRISEQRKNSKRSDTRYDLVDNEEDL